jgi:hypothetical protein
MVSGDTSIDDWRFNLTVGGRYSVQFCYTGAFSSDRQLLDNCRPDYCVFFHPFSCHSLISTNPSISFSPGLGPSPTLRS